MYYKHLGFFVGDLHVSPMNPDDPSQGMWIEEPDGDGTQIQPQLLLEFYNKYF